MRDIRDVRNSVPCNNKCRRRFSSNDKRDCERLRERGINERGSVKRTTELFAWRRSRCEIKRGIRFARTRYNRTIRTRTRTRTQPKINCNPPDKLVIHRYR